MGVIADMIRAGVDPELIERVAMEMLEATRHGLPVRSSAAIRQQRYRDRLKAAEGVTTATRDVTRYADPLSPPPPKNTNQTPSTPIPQPKARAKARTALGGEAQPTDADRKAAEVAGLTPVEFRDEWRAFRDHHVSRGTLMADWQAAWRTWLRNRKKFAPRASPQSQSAGGGWAKLMAKSIAEKCNGHDGERLNLQNVPMLPISNEDERGSMRDDDGGILGNRAGVLIASSFKRM